MIEFAGVSKSNKMETSEISSERLLLRWLAAGKDLLLSKSLLAEHKPHNEAAVRKETFRKRVAGTSHADLEALKTARFTGFPFTTV